MATANPSANFTRPNNTTAYASGNLIANSTTNTLVVPLTLTLSGNTYGQMSIRRIRIKKSTNVTTNAQFRVHLYDASPTVTNGDGGAWLSTESTYYGACDVTVDKAFSDPASEGVGSPNNGTEINIIGGQDKIVYGLIEARAAYTPGAQEVFTVILETVSQNF